MSAIERIGYKNKLRVACAIEIVDLQVFLSTRPHHHLERDFRLNFWTLIYITKGEGIHYIDFESYPYKAGDIIFVNKNQVNHFQINPDVEGYIIIINEPFFLKGEGLSAESFLSFFDRSYKNPVLPVEYIMTSTNRILLELMYKEYMKSYKHYNENLIRGLFQSFIFSLEVYAKEDTGSVESTVFKTYNQFSQLVESNYTKIKSVDEYSKLMMVSKKTINNATRKVVGLSAKQFIISRIILEIKRYLSQGDLMNYEISDLLGFDEPANLTNFFKRYEKISPSAFKASLKIN